MGGHAHRRRTRHAQGGPGRHPRLHGGQDPHDRGPDPGDPRLYAGPLRGHGYAGAATAEVSRAALAAGATEVLLFADLANPTSNGLYQRIGYRPVAGFARYDFSAPSRNRRSLDGARRGGST